VIVDICGRIGTGVADHIAGGLFGNDVGMRSAVLRNGAMFVRDDVDEPSPGQGEVLIEVAACGICGSDLHFARFGAEMMDVTARMEGTPDVGRTPPDLARDVFMGHEFCGRVLDLGPMTDGPTPGTVVTSVPIMVTATGLQDLAYTNLQPCGYSERMLLSAFMTLEVPNGLTPQHAALTEPMAVGLHAVNRSGLAAGDGAVVVGCGPVGLAVIAALELLGVAPIVAADFSPARRALAATMGADEVVDPAVETPFSAWNRVGAGRTMAAFEAVGVPGVIDELLRVAPSQSRIVVVGVCMQPDSITPMYGIGKELNLQFVLGYTPEEFAESLRSIAEGDIDVAPMITGQVGLTDVPAAFEALANPEQHCKILVVPERSAS
jgi:threonine dehydrogenase-like Zn-dependent dehydrogenase